MFALYVRTVCYLKCFEIVYVFSSVAVCDVLNSTTLPACECVRLCVQRCVSLRGPVSDLCVSGEVDCGLFIGRVILESMQAIPSQTQSRARQRHHGQSSDDAGGRPRKQRRGCTWFMLCWQHLSCDPNECTSLFEGFTFCSAASFY